MFVCPSSANAIKCLYSILNTAIGFLLSIEVFNLWIYLKRLLLEVTAIFTLLYDMAAICNQMRSGVYLGAVQSTYKVGVVRIIYVRTELAVAPYHLWLARLGSVYCRPTWYIYCMQSTLRMCSIQIELTLLATW